MTTCKHAVGKTWSCNFCSFSIERNIWLGWYPRPALGMPDKVKKNLFQFGGIGHHWTVLFFSCTKRPSHEGADHLNQNYVLQWKKKMLCLKQNRGRLEPHSTFYSILVRLYDYRICSVLATPLFLLVFWITKRANVFWVHIHIPWHYSHWEHSPCKKKQKNTCSLKLK